MRAMIQRVSKASVSVDSKTVGSIGRGLLVYVGGSSIDKADDALLIGRKLFKSGYPFISEKTPVEPVKWMSLRGSA